MESGQAAAFRSRIAVNAKAGKLPANGRIVGDDEDFVRRCTNGGQHAIDDPCAA
jgi:hypothetical protein